MVRLGLGADEKWGGESVTPSKLHGFEVLGIASKSTIFVGGHSRNAFFLEI